MRLLVIEDEKSLLKIITRRLKEEGYSVDAVTNGRDGENYIYSTDYDCIILDIMIPVVDGLTLLRRIREKKISTPVLLLTARDSIEDRVVGLDTGADDYLVKPFSFDELLARVRALLRRQKEKRDIVLSLGDLKLDTVTREVKRGDRSIELTSKEYSILEYFLKNKNRVLTKSQIAEHVWNYDFEYNSNIVEVYIRYLRRKIDEDFKNKLIHTIRGGGYVLRDESKKTDNKI
ncbi:MAG: response regulator transcription factor [Actinomycetota bacterium]|nr:response regulator transcription factor [Actinomycetota bacterium]